VTYKGREQPIRCVIHDMSDGGARISLEVGPGALPRAFTLVLLKDCLQRNCSVVWTNGRFFGVKFISEWFGAKLSERPRFQEVRQGTLNQCLTGKAPGPAIPMAPSTLKAGARQPECRQHGAFQTRGVLR
jgi:hypothetical protein